MDITDEEIGKRYNNLTIVEYTNKRNGNRSKIYTCKCDCGNTKDVSLNKLKNGTKSCGCLKAKNIAPRFGQNHPQWNGYEGISRSFYSRIKASAEQRNIQFDLSIEYLWDLYLKQNKTCDLTGSNLELPLYIKELRNKSDQRLASLDRIDNSKGYVLGNVRWICKRLNYMKHVLSDDEFFGWIKEIYEYKKL